MKTLVTGATGLVGYNNVKALLNEKRQVKVLVRSLEKAKRLLPSECELVKGDITDIASIENAVKDCDVIYHAAGFPEQWMKNNDIFTKINVEGTQNMVDVALKNKVSRFIYTSTIDVFAGKKDEEYDESVIDPYLKGTYYERSKQEADRRVVKALEKGLPAVFLHPSGVYGPGPTDSPGTNDFITKVKNKKLPALLPGGLPIVYAEDIGKGHLLAELKAPIGGRYILSEAYYTLPELVKIVLEELKMDATKIPVVLPIPVVKLLSTLGEMLSQITNSPPLMPKGQMLFLQWQARPKNHKAIRELGWKPTPTREGIRKTIDFLFKNEGLNRDFTQ